MKLTTVRDFIRLAVSQFNKAGLYFGHGTETAWDEAVALILHALYLPHDINPMVMGAHLTAEEQQTILDLIKQRVTKRVPLAYLTHEAYFAGLPFYVDERVLIPRSGIAELIENQFEPWINPKSVTQILDLCTGSGCIAIACSMAFPDAEVSASDISSEALAVAKINILRHKVETQVTLHQSDLFDELPNKKYDIIVSNPPYVDADDMATLPQEYLHEPKLALAAGTQGLDIVLKILNTARDYLTPQGILVVEVGNSEQALANHFPEVPFIWLELQRSDGGIFLLTAEQLDQYFSPAQTAAP